MLNTLESLFKLARNRKSNPLDGSYTNKLLSDKSLSKEKVLEEVNELVKAVDENNNTIHEAADVFYHFFLRLLQQQYIEIQIFLNSQQLLLHFERQQC